MKLLTKVTLPGGAESLRSYHVGVGTELVTAEDLSNLMLTRMVEAGYTRSRLSAKLRGFLVTDTYSDGSTGPSSLVACVLEKTHDKITLLAAIPPPACPSSREMTSGERLDAVAMLQSVSEEQTPLQVVVTVVPSSMEAPMQAETAAAAEPPAPPPDDSARGAKRVRESEKQEGVAGGRQRHSGKRLAVSGAVRCGRAPCLSGAMSVCLLSRPGS